MEIISAELTNQDLSDIQEKLKSKIIVPNNGAKMELQAIFDGHSIFVGFTPILETELPGSTYMVKNMEISFCATIDMFQPKDCDGILCKAGYSDTAYKDFVKFIEFKLNN